MPTKQFNQLFHESGGFKKLTVRTLTITPQFASDLLSLNKDNRPINNGTIKRYVHEMQSGKWKFTGGDAIVIANTSKLLNGQHRLHAIIESDSPQTFNLQTGVDESTYQFMDIGRNRTGADIMYHLGFKSATTIAFVARFMILMAASEKGKPYALAIRSSNEDLANWCKECTDREFLSQAVNNGQTYHNRFKPLATTTISALLYWFAQIDKDKAFDFFDMLTSGEGCSTTKNSSIYLLRQKLINISSTNYTLRLQEKYAVIIKAWNLFRDGKEIKQLSFQGNEAYPTPY